MYYVWNVLYCSVLYCNTFFKKICNYVSNVVYVLYTDAMVMYCTVLKSTHRWRLHELLDMCLEHSGAGRGRRGGGGLTAPEIGTLHP